MKSITDRIYGLRLAVKRIEECCHSIIASIRKVKKNNRQHCSFGLPRTFKIKKVGFFKCTVFSFCQVSVDLIASHVDKGMVKIRDMFKVDDEAAVCLEKTVFGKFFQPVLHIMDGFKITQCCMYDYFSCPCFYCNDVGSRKCVYTLLCFNRYFDCHSIV